MIEIFFQQAIIPSEITLWGPDSHNFIPFTLPYPDVGLEPTLNPSVCFQDGLFLPRFRLAARASQAILDCLGTRHHFRPFQRPLKLGKSQTALHMNCKSFGIHQTSHECSRVSYPLYSCLLKLQHRKQIGEGPIHF